MAQGRLLNIRLFVEGIEIPCASATVSCGIQQPAQGSFEIPFAVSAKEILPRTLVHLFFFESAYDEVDVAKGEAPTFKQRNSSDPKAWKLLFAGEVVAVQFLKVAGLAENAEAVNYASYLVELALPEYSMLRFRYSQVAAAAVYATMSMYEASYDALRQIHQHSTYAQHEVSEVINALAALAAAAPSASLTAVHKKFSLDRMHNVAGRGAPQVSDSTSYMEF